MHMRPRLRSTSRWKSSASLEEGSPPGSGESLPMADVLRYTPMLLGNSRGEDGDGVDAVVAGAAQDVSARFRIAQTIALRPVVRFQKISQPLPPVAVEDGLLDVVAIDAG